MYAIALLVELTLKEILKDIPYDPAAIVVYVMLGLFGSLIWYGSRPSAGTRDTAPRGAVPAEDRAEPAPRTAPRDAVDRAGTARGETARFG